MFCFVVLILFKLWTFHAKFMDLLKSLNVTERTNCFAIFFWPIKLSVILITAEMQRVVWFFFLSSKTGAYCVHAVVSLTSITEQRDYGRSGIVFPYHDSEIHIWYVSAPWLHDTEYPGSHLKLEIIGIGSPVVRVLFLRFSGCTAQVYQFVLRSLSRGNIRCFCGAWIAEAWDERIFYASGLPLSGKMNCMDKSLETRT